LSLFKQFREDVVDLFTIFCILSYRFYLLVLLSFSFGGDPSTGIKPTIIKSWVMFPLQPSKRRQTWESSELIKGLPLRFWSSVMVRVSCVFVRFHVLDNAIRSAPIWKFWRQQWWGTERIQWVL